MGGNSADGCKYILDAMVELSTQGLLMFLCSFTLRDIDVDAHYPIWVSIAAIRNESARFDPSNLATRSDNSILIAVFALLAAESARLSCLAFILIIGMYAGLPLATRYFSRAFLKTVNGCITRRDLHCLRADVVCEAADESGFSRQLSLHGALCQGQLSRLPLADVASQAFDAHKPPTRVKLALRCLLQPHLLSVRSDKAESHGIRRPAAAQLAYACL